MPFPPPPPPIIVVSRSRWKLAILHHDAPRTRALSTDERSMIRASKGAQRSGAATSFSKHGQPIFFQPPVFSFQPARGLAGLFRARGSPIRKGEEGGGWKQRRCPFDDPCTSTETVTRRCFSPRDPPTQLGFFFVQSTEFRHPVGIKPPPSSSSSSCSGSRD